MFRKSSTVEDSCSVLVATDRWAMYLNAIRVGFIALFIIHCLPAADIPTSRYVSSLARQT